jgi:hypothetical protein
MGNTNSIKGTLPEPIRPESLPKKAQWLAGEGAGSWFLIEDILEKSIFKVTRYSPEGKIECEGNFEIADSNDNLDLSKPYQFIHLSHCAFVHIKQGEVIKLNRIGFTQSR